MKCDYIIHDGSPVLTLFFSGWGGERCLFDGYVPVNSDFMLCHDYRTLDFDASVLDGYEDIRLAAWSMGVWVAATVLRDVNAHFLSCTAVNGTMMPVDDRYGIPVQVFRGTLENMDGTVLKKFRRRMCGSQDNYAAFMGHGPELSAECLKDELDVLYRTVTSSPAPVFRWSRAFAGSRDRIFPAGNQSAAWMLQGTPVEVYDADHYSELLFAKAIEDR